MMKRSRLRRRAGTLAVATLPFLLFPAYTYAAAPDETTGSDELLYHKNTGLDNKDRFNDINNGSKIKSTVKSSWHSIKLLSEKSRELVKKQLGHRQ